MRIEATQVQCSREARTISGMLFPFDVAATPSAGPERVMFASDGEHTAAGRLWLNLDHQSTRRIGFTDDLEIRDGGVWATWNILQTSAGNDALVEAAEGARHAFSVEAEIVTSEAKGGVEVVRRSEIVGAALTGFPAFSTAVVERVAATETEKGNPVEDNMPDPTPTPDPAPPVVDVRVPVAATAPRPTVGAIVAAAMNNDRAEYQRLVHAAAPHTLSTDVQGLIPSSIVGALIDTAANESPLFNALGALAAPASNLFTMPVLTTPLTAAAAAAEKTDVTAQLGITDVTVDMVALKRAVNVSEESLAWASAGNLLQIIADQLAKSVVRGRETYAVTTVEAVTGTMPSVSIAANGSDAWSKIAKAVGDAFKQNHSQPTLAALTMDTWSKLAGFTNSVGAPLVNGIEQSVNGGRGLLFGLPIVVSPSLTKDYLIDGSLAWSFVNANVRATINEPTILGRSFGIMQGVGVLAMPKALTPLTVATS